MNRKIGSIVQEEEDDKILLASNHGDNKGQELMEEAIQGKYFIHIGQGIEEIFE